MVVTWTIRVNLPYLACGTSIYTRAAVETVRGLLFQLLRTISHSIANQRTDTYLIYTNWTRVLSHAAGLNH